MEAEPKLLEREAYSFLSQEKFEEAFSFFKRAASIYKRQGNHKQASLCFTSAASCWSKKSGEKTFSKAALAYEEAAREAKESRDYEHASLLYKYAAINHERDGEFFNFSDCFYNSKESYRKFLTYRLINPNKINPIRKTREKRGIKGFFVRIFSWLILTSSYLAWGHGERPSRTFFSGIAIVFLAAFFYSFGNLLKEGVIFSPNFFEAFYFSVITFTTVGYGDFTPVGISKLVAIVEAFTGLFIIPLFIIGLSRKYLRV